MPPPAMTGGSAGPCKAWLAASTHVGGRPTAMDERDDLDPTAAPKMPHRRPYTVHVSEAIEYQGWVLATDVDDADDQARRLLDDGGSATDRGHGDIVRFDREVIANDADEVCWQCRTDPHYPNPACPPPPPRLDRRQAADPTPGVPFPRVPDPPP